VLVDNLGLPDRETGAGAEAHDARSVSKTASMRTTASRASGETGGA
jgi:hypothetical protein